MGIPPTPRAPCTWSTTWLVKDIGRGDRFQATPSQRACRLVNSTPLGTVLDERQRHRHRSRAGFRVGNGRHVDLLSFDMPPGYMTSICPGTWKPWPRYSGRATGGRSRRKWGRAEESVRTSQDCLFACCSGPNDIVHFRARNPGRKLVRGEGGNRAGVGWIPQEFAARV